MLSVSDWVKAPIDRRWDPEGKPQSCLLGFCSNRTLLTGLLLGCCSIFCVSFSSALLFSYDNGYATYCMRITSLRNSMKFYTQYTAAPIPGSFVHRQEPLEDS